ncbi:MAG: flavodoxin family protein [Candidatus Methanomethylophilaceae archaeon]
MKVLIISGGMSGGYTDRMCGDLCSMLSGEHDVTRLPCDLDISQCTGCQACSGGACVFDDDMDVVFREFGKADAVIFSTPVRFNGPSSQIKTLMDRFQELWNNPDRVEARPRLMGLMMTCGSSNPDIRPNLTVFRSFCMSFGGVWIGHSLVKCTDSGEADIRSGAAEMADRLLSSVMR